ncbi:Translationally controlled tumour protein [Streptomyces sp. ScaeMP-6W]|nr:Translationally controlled tumour protein [Streptomyces sp. ScaeMP-6W]
MEGVKGVLEDFDSWRFFQGESVENDAMIVFLGTREDGTPYLRFSGTAFAPVVKSTKATITGRRERPRSVRTYWWRTGLVRYGHRSSRPSATRGLIGSLGIAP